MKGRGGDDWIFGCWVVMFMGIFWVRIVEIVWICVRGKGVCYFWVLYLGWLLFFGGSSWWCDEFLF